MTERVIKRPRMARVPKNESPCKDSDYIGVQRSDGSKDLSLHFSIPSTIGTDLYRFEKFSLLKVGGGRLPDVGQLEESCRPTRYEVFGQLNYELAGTFGE